MKKILFLLFALLVAHVSAFADEVQFTASAPGAVVKGEQFRVSYTVTTQKVKEFRAPSFEGFEVLMGPSSSRSSSTSIVNGEVTSTSTITYTYILMGVKEGKYSIPGASIVADGDSKTSNSLKIKELPPDQTTGNGQQTGRGQGRASGASANGQISNNDLFITATVNKTNAYEQEAILLTYKVYFTVNLRELEIKMPDLKGFLTQEVELQRGQATLEHYQGRNYNTIVWSQYVLFPQQAGKLEIPSINFDATVAVRTQRSIDPLDMFFNGGVDVRKTISTPKLTVNVTPLPTGKPASFAGGVGEFDLKSSITTTELKANEAVTLKLEISGVGNMKLVSTPDVDFPQDFETYDPKVDNKFSLTRNGLSGKKVIEYLAIPRHAGTFTIPPVEFSYFDLKTKSYKTLTTEPYELNVAKGESLFAQQSDLNRAKQLINQEQYLDGAKLLRPLADGGNAEAQELAAWLFFSGKGVTASDEQGVKYATMATEQGRSWALSMLITYYSSNSQKEKAIEVFGKYAIQSLEMGIGLIRDMDRELLLTIVGGYFNQRMNDLGITDGEVFIEKLYEINPIEGEMFMELSIVSRGNDEEYYNLLANNLNQNGISSLGYAILAKMSFEGRGVLLNHRQGLIYANKAAENNSHMGTYLLTKYEKMRIPGYFYSNAVLFDINDVNKGMVFSRTTVDCTWKNIKKNLQQMEKYMRVPTMEEAKEMMPYYCWSKDMKAGETITIWTVRLVLAEVYYWQTYDHKGNLIKEEPRHNYVGSAFNGNATLLTVWQTNL